MQLLIFSSLLCGSPTVRLCCVFYLVCLSVPLSVYPVRTLRVVISEQNTVDKNSLGDEIANFYAVRPGSYPNSLK